MIRFEHIDFLWGLAAIPVLALIFVMIIRWREKMLRLFGDYQIVSGLVPDLSKGKPIAKFILFCLAWTFLVIGLANPQIGSKLEEIKREGVDLIIALDVSNSMKAEDLSPNRLERAKRAIAQLLEKLHNDRIGIIVFAGQAYVQLPITTDYAAAKLFLGTIDTDVIPTQGTAIGTAIDLSLESFDFKNNTSKAIIVITDGENHEDDAIAAAEDAAGKDVTVHTIGMGSAQGAPIPVYKGKRQVDFRKDKEGNTVITKLNEEMLQKIAASGNGIYVRANNAQIGLGHILDEINKMEKVEFDAKVYTDYEDRFQYFIGLALLFLLLEFLLSEKKSKWIEKINLFDVKS